MVVLEGGGRQWMLWAVGGGGKLVVVLDSGSRWGGGKWMGVRVVVNVTSALGVTVKPLQTLENLKSGKFKSARAPRRARAYVFFNETY